ncbi:hypothetical protein KJ632_04885 [Patescibacteria group bacterium]|nr:hypothetical protein [Patescibacteria group bacterium]
MEILKKIAPTFNGKKFEIPMWDLEPDERLRRRVAHRNERFIYRTASAIDGKPLVSIYSPDKPYKIYSLDYWFSDNWDPMDYGRDFDFGSGFFEQFNELCLAVPRANMMTMQNENSEYTTGTGFCRNCYLINSSEHCEDCYYGKLLQTCKNCVDCAYAYDSELLYQCFNVRGLYNCQFVYNSSNSSDCFFCDNMSNCRNCFLCTNLNGKEYYFQNKKCESKEAYEKIVSDFRGKYSNYKKAWELFEEMRAGRVYKYAEIMNCENCSGDFIKNSKNCANCYDVNDSEDCENVHVGVKCKDVYDSSNMYEGPELSWQTLGVIATFNVHFSIYQFNCSDMWYCDTCYNSKNCFGCVGLRNKQYCIFNKQYSAEEYEVMVARIIEKMIETGEWGQFFPPQYSPFGYNESLANEYLPLGKEEALERGFKWSDYDKPLVEAGKMIEVAELPDSIADVDEKILDTAIKCEVSGKPFVVTGPELKFYKKMAVPVPHKHPDVRYDERIAVRKPRKLWERVCDKCGNSVKSVFEPDGVEKIYCEKCYLAEVR